MRVPLTWLKKYVSVNQSTQEIADKLTMIGFETEKIDDPSQIITQVFVGKIVMIERHPNADKLVVCRVDIGKAVPLQIVTAATNVREGMFIPVALHGATLAGGLEIKRSKLRGIESEGMMCSDVELGLAKESTGIKELSVGLRLGAPIFEALGLTHASIEINVLPNRPDCLSLMGVARELAAAYDCSIVHPTVNKPLISELTDSIVVINDSPDVCYRYMGLSINNVVVKPSPDWLQDALKMMGLEPINNIVDLSNYVMFELGQPLHAFDRDLIKGNKMMIRYAKPGESITLLDHRTVELKTNQLVIADAIDPLAVAGVMGGQQSAISDQTTSIFVEAALFSGPLIRRTALALDAHTDSGYRFERGLSYEGVELGFWRFVSLIHEIAGGDIVSKVIDVAGDSRVSVDFLPYDINVFERLMGMTLDREWVANKLTSLGFEVKGSLLKIPYFRQDIRESADIAEEIARHYGYTKLPSIVPTKTVFHSQLVSLLSGLKERVRDYFTHNGFQEIYTYAMVSKEDYLAINPSIKRDEQALTITNPLSQELEYLRDSLIVPMLLHVRYNAHHHVLANRVLEIGTVFKQGISPSDEAIMVGGYILSETLPTFYKPKITGETADTFFTVKGLWESFLSCAGFRGIVVQAGEKSGTHAGRTAIFRMGKNELGFVAELAPDLALRYDVPGRMVVFEFNLDILIKFFNPSKRYKSFSLNPMIRRDISFWVNKEITSLSLKTFFEKNSGSFFSYCDILEVFHSDKQGADYYNIVFSIYYQDKTRTLTEDEINSEFDKTATLLQRTFLARFGS